MSDPVATTTDELARLLEVAHVAVDLAIEVLHDRPPPQVRWKGDGDPVTDADLAIERALREHLAHHTPDIGFLGEEEGLSGPTAAQDATADSAVGADPGADPGAGPARQWVLDPIDGTANYLHGLPLHAISLGLLDDHRPVLGVVALPALGHRYSGHAGGGAHRDGDRIEASTAARSGDAVVSLGDYGVGAEAAGANRTRLDLMAALAGRVRRVRMLGSAAVDLAWVADGTLDATVMLANAPWDVTAGIAIAREAGATVTDAAGGPHGSASSSVLAAAPSLAAELATIAGSATGA